MRKIYCDDAVCVLDQEPVLRVEGLSLRYDRVEAFRDVSFELPGCSVTAVIGPSGCGKSSFLQCVNRMTDLIERCQVSGKIFVHGTDVMALRKNSLELRKRVGMIFQKPNPFPMSIRKNIALPLKYHGIRKRQQRQELVEQSLQDVGLWEEVKDRLDDSALLLSGGQQQRLCIARAIALDPEILLMDEPCSALDPASTDKVEQLIARLRKRFTLIVVTHNLPQAKRISDTTVVFWHTEGVGHVVEHGPTDRVFMKPSSPIAQTYIEGRVG